jgi:pimeloyl-ACP methyl ester carboxylesterase
VFEKLKLLQYGARVKRHASDKEFMIDVGGRQTQVMRAGNGAPLVYFHTAIGETIWLPFHQTLSEHFDVIAPAHPGFGQSAGYEEVENVEDLVFHYLDLFETLRLERFNLVGGSLGGWIAAEFAVRYPERIERLVLADAAGLWLDEWPIPDFFTKLQDPRGLRSLLLSNPDSFFGDLLFPTETDDDRLELAFKAMQTTARLGWNPFMHNPKLHKRLRRISSPTLVLWGADDKLLAPAYAEAWHKAIPGSQLRILDDCGHLPMFEQESQFVESVTDYLKN